MTVDIILLVIAALLLVGMLFGCTLTVQALQARTRRQAAMQCALNSQWLELESQREELESQWKELEISRQQYIKMKERVINAATNDDHQWINSPTISRSRHQGYVDV